MQRLLRASRDHERLFYAAGFVLLTGFQLALSQDPTKEDSSSIIVHGSRTEKKIALTFDACSPYKRSGYDKRIVDTLVETGTKATFFLGGRWILAHPKETRYLASLPQFELANHTFSHRHLTSTITDSIRLELRLTQEVLKKVAGKPATLFRAPYGELNRQVVEIARNMGLTTVQYDLASGDPDTTFTRKILERYVVSAARNGSIIVMHVNGRGWHTAEALPGIIRKLRERGFEFVTVGEMNRR
ncbi:MAG: polysaccharide deacetylase family protein [Bacteroidota bacterium]